MKIVLTLLGLFVIGVLSRPQQPPGEIVVYESDVGADAYNFKYETSNGIAQQEQGELKNSADDPEGILSVTGAYSYIDDQGKEHRVQYAADEKGFRILPGSSL